MVRFAGQGCSPGTFLCSRTLKSNDRFNTQFRAEAFNVFNHTNPDGLYTAYGFGGFGAIAGVRDPRIMQLGLKLYF
jgi:hypothetical protein